MPRNMSFSLTTEAVREQRKDVTRRLGWWFLRPGDIVNACEKCMGLKKGERVRRIWQIRILDTHPEALLRITKAEVVREGFSEMTPEDFIAFFCRTHKCHSDEVVNRIEFEYVDSTRHVDEPQDGCVLARL